MYVSRDICIRIYLGGSPINIHMYIRIYLGGSPINIHIYIEIYVYAYISRYMYTHISRRAACARHDDASRGSRVII